MRPLWARQGWTGDDPSAHPAFLVLGQALGASFLQPGLGRGEAWVTLPPRKVLEALRILREEPSLRFNVLSDITAVHWPEREKPFEVVYQLYSIPHRSRYRVKVPLEEGEEIASATVLWKAAEWMEREVFDLFGIPFTGHPDLRRILNPEDFEGHPLRKDFPLLGKAGR